MVRRQNGISEGFEPTEAYDSDLCSDNICPLQLPLCGGMDVLRWIRATDDLKALVVIMFTSSHHPRDIDTAYGLGVNSFVVKPITLSDRAEFARELKAWWLNGNQIPTRCSPHEIWRASS